MRRRPVYCRHQPLPTRPATSENRDRQPPDLTPWLAGVFVSPEARGRGHVIHLIRAVEGACWAVAILWCGLLPMQKVRARVLGDRAWKAYASWQAASHAHAA